MSALHPLRPEQRRASEPGAHAWVSASAGTGKTQVLTARVLRLLLSGAAPERVLCLTFTKAAAAEMQTRIYATLARWVRAGEAELDRIVCRNHGALFHPQTGFCEWGPCTGHSLERFELSTDGDDALVQVPAR